MDILKMGFVKHGLMLTGVTVLCLLFMEATGQNNSFDNKSPILLFLMVVAPAIILYSAINAKKKILKNKLKLKQGITEGFKTSLVYGIVSPFVYLFYYLLINSKILESVKDMYGMGTSPNSMVIVVDMLAQFIMALVFGTIYSVAISFLLKTKSK